jgi:hypothetical protein
MGIMDLFSGKAGRKAAAAQIAALRDTQGQATGAIDAGLAQGLPYLVGPGGATGALQSGHGDALSALRGYYGDARGDLTKATTAFSPMIRAGSSGVDAYMDALGLGGGDATAAFRNTPGYAFARDEGLEAVKRAAAARGDLASGNVTADLMRYATGFADQNYGNYLARLQPLMAMYGQGIAGRAGGLTNMGQAATGMGTATAGLHTGLGGNLADVYRTAAALPVAAGTSKAGILTNLGSQIAQTTGQGMMAGQQGSANLLNALMGVGGLATNFLGAAMMPGTAGAGKAGPSLFNKWFG